MAIHIAIHISIIHIRVSVSTVALEVTNRAFRNLTPRSISRSRDTLQNLSLHKSDTSH
jgi:hypothetical protein